MAYKDLGQHVEQATALLLQGMQINETLGTDMTKTLKR